MYAVVPPQRMTKSRPRLLHLSTNRNHVAMLKSCRICLAVDSNCMIIKEMDMPLQCGHIYQPG